MNIHEQCNIFFHLLVAGPCRCVACRSRGPTLTWELGLGQLKNMASLLLPQHPGVLIPRQIRACHSKESVEFGNEIKVLYCSFSFTNAYNLDSGSKWALWTGRWDTEVVPRAHVWAAPCCILRELIMSEWEQRVPQQAEHLPSEARGAQVLRFSHLLLHIRSQTEKFKPSTFLSRPFWARWYPNHFQTLFLR